VERGEIHRHRALWRHPESIPHRRPGEEKIGSIRPGSLSLYENSISLKRNAKSVILEGKANTYPVVARKEAERSSTSERRGLAYGNDETLSRHQRRLEMLPRRRDILERNMPQEGTKLDGAAGGRSGIPPSGALKEMSGRLSDVERKSGLSRRVGGERRNAEGQLKAKSASCTRRSERRRRLPSRRLARRWRR